MRFEKGANLNRQFSMPDQQPVIPSDAIEDILNGECGEDDPHHARGDMNAAFTHQSNQARAQIQHYERNQKDHGDRDADGG